MGVGIDAMKIIPQRRKAVVKKASYRSASVCA